MRSIRPRNAWMLWAGALGLACSSDDAVQGDATTLGTTAADSTASQGFTSTSGAGSSTDPTAADSSGGVAPAPCSCAQPDAFEGDDSSCSAEALAAWVPGCPEAQPCARLTVECPRPGADLYDCTSELTYDEPAMQCMLETLRDGTPARLEIDGLEDDGVFSGQSQYVVHVLEGRMALRAGCQSIDVGVLAFEPRLGVLLAPDYFTGCMAMEAPADRYDCMISGLGERPQPLDECP